MASRAERIFNEAFRAWLHDQLEHPAEGVRRALRRSVWSRDGRDNDDGPIDRIRRAGRELAEWRDFEGEWRRVPDHLILNRSDNPTGRAIACWTPQVGILCFVRAPES